MKVPFGGIDPKKHIWPEDRRRNSEENTKVKCVVPYLRDLGWDLLEDLWFEESRADILVRLNGRPFLVVEVKGWGAALTDATRRQLLAYAVEHGPHWTLFTNGETFRLFHSLALRTSGSRTLPPLAETRFRDGKQGKDCVGSLIRRPRSAAGVGELQTRAATLLGFSDWPALEREWKKFRKRWRPPSRSPERMTLDRFEAYLNALEPKTRGAYRLLYRGLQDLDRDFGLIAWLERESKSVGLRVRDPISERNKWLGVLGIYPRRDRPSIAAGYSGWKALELDRLTRESLKKAATKFNKSPSEQVARTLVKLLRKLFNCAQVAHERRSRLRR